jgi:hypothetical protein
MATVYIVGNTESSFICLIALEKTMPLEPISSSLSILASILNIAIAVKQYAATKGTSIKEAIIGYYDQANHEEKALLARDGMGATIEDLAVISSQLLAQLRDEAEDCEARYIARRKAANSKELDLQKAKAKACKCMCGRLTDIKFHNKGVLPDSDTFKEWWDCYDCEEDEED